MISDLEPHGDPVEAIVAASGDSVRREIADLTRAAQFTVGALAPDTATLAGLLRSSSPAWVVTGGASADARPFIETALAARAATVAVLSDRGGRPRDWMDTLNGCIALLSSSVTRIQFRAAVMASRAGLSVWEPSRPSGRTETESLATPLSPRERSVIELAGSGLSTKAVARTLGISPNTVKFHLQAAFDKLGVASRAEAVMVAIRRGELAV